jgi:hypothetical protein
LIATVQIWTIFSQILDDFCFYWSNCSYSGAYVFYTTACYLFDTKAMTSKNPSSPMRNINPSGQISPSTSAYSPSVPISLYREVTADLQVAKTTMEALTQQNQQLAKQNQQLRQEIERAAQSAIHLRQIVTNLPPVASADLPTSPAEIDLSIPTMPSRPPVAPRPARTEAAFSADTIVYEQESQPRRKIQSEKKPSELGGWWLGVVIVLIVITAFGTGFLIVRPLLPSSNK